MEIIKYKDESEGYLAKNTDNTHYKVKQMNKATVFNNGEAKKFITTYVKKVFRDRIEIVKIDECVPSIAFNKEKDESYITPTSNLQNITNQTPFDNLDYDWLTKLKNDEQFRKDIATYRIKLPIMLDEVNNRLCDYEHVIENCSLGASELSMIGKLIKWEREKRKKIKKEIELTDIIHRDFISGKGIDSALYIINKQNNSPYKPRLMPELFEKGGISKIYNIEKNKRKI